MTQSEIDAPWTCPACYGPRHRDSGRWWCNPSCARWGVPIAGAWEANTAPQTEPCPLDGRMEPHRHLADEWRAWDDEKK